MLDTKTLLWIISALLAIIIFFVQDVWHDVKELKLSIEDRTLILDCEKNHKEVDKYLHRHAKSGTSGEEVSV